MSVNKQLGDFLRQRRERLEPQRNGLPARQRRRTPGMRREEVAELAGISVDWYIRLEQGRNSRPSKTTVESLAKALRLNHSDRAHLLRLALGSAGRAFTKEKVPLHLSRLIQELSTPAYLIGARYDLLCWNKAAIKVFRDFAKIPEDERNMLYQMFTVPELRERYPDWAADARAMVEGFRANYDFWADSADFVSLKEELCTLSVEFRKWWKHHEVRTPSSGEKLLRHRELGKVRLRYATFQSNDNRNLRLVLWSGVPPASRKPSSKR